MARYIGVDLTAGTADSQFDAGPAPFPAVCLDDTSGALAVAAIETFTSLRTFRAWIATYDPVQIGIDGPCGALGIALAADRSGFVLGDSQTRPAERALAKAGIGLFWTTRATIENFDGAARWIARSFALFEDLQGEGRDPFETHPHGAFTLWHRASGSAETLAKKTTETGRSQRLALLRTFLPVEAESLPDDDHVDATAAAVMAWLKEQGRAEAYGEHDEGGQIWLPSP